MSFKSSLQENKFKARSSWGGAVGASLLFGLVSAAHADGAIAPVTEGALVPQPPEAPAASVPAPTQSMIEGMEFEDIETAKLLQIIAKSFNLQVVIADDVDGKIRAINLGRKTPHEAVMAVVQAARLQYQLNNGTYIIAKVLNEPGEKTNNRGPENEFGTGGITPNGAGAWQNPNANPFGTRLPESRNAVSLPGFGTFEQPTLNPNLDLPVLVKNRENDRKYSRALRVRNVRPGIIAWWLDPANNQVPREFAQAAKNWDRATNRSRAELALSREDMAAVNGNSSPVVLPGFNSGSTSSNPYLAGNSTATGFNSSALMVDTRSSAQFGRPGGGGGGGGAAGRGGGGVFQLPEGVDRVVAIDPQNALLVFGTDEGVRQLQDIIGILDRPLRQVEIEAQFVTVETGDSRAFGINYQSSNGAFDAAITGFQPAPPEGAGALSVGFVRGNFRATLAALVNTNRAKLITAPRVTAINNLTATLQTSRSVPILLTSTTSNIGGNVGQAQNLLYITTTTGLTVTPTINNDDTVTVLMQPQVEGQADSGLAVPAPIITQSTIETIANVRDGDTIALGGLKTKTISRGGSKVPLIGDLPLIGPLFRSRRATDSESDLIIFLTARIIRRYGDDDAVTGAGP